MIIDIRKTVFKKKVRSFFTTIFFLILLALFLATEIFPYEMAGMSKYQFSIVIAGIYIAIVLFNTLRNYFYIFYNDEGEEIILRFFSLSYFTQKKRSIEIQKKDIAGFKVIKSLSGLRENLIIYQKTKKGTAKYPSVSLTALSKQEKEKLINSLSRFGRNLD